MQISDYRYKLTGFHNEESVTNDGTKRSPTLWVVEEDSINDTSSSLVICGRTTTNHDYWIYNNMLQLLENFSSPKIPDYPTYGQLWHNTSQFNDGNLHKVDNTLVQIYSNHGRMQVYIPADAWEPRGDYRYGSYQPEKHVGLKLQNTVKPGFFISPSGTEVNKHGDVTFLGRSYAYASDNGLPKVTFDNNIAPEPEEWRNANITKFFADNNYLSGYYNLDENFSNANVFVVRNDRKIAYKSDITFANVLEKGTVFDRTTNVDDYKALVTKKYTDDNFLSGIDQTSSKKANNNDIFYVKDNKLIYYGDSTYSLINDPLVISDYNALVPKQYTDENFLSGIDTNANTKEKFILNQDKIILYDTNTDVGLPLQYSTGTKTAEEALVPKKYIDKNFLSGKADGNSETLFTLKSGKLINYDASTNVGSPLGATNKETLVPKKYVDNNFLSGTNTATSFVVPAAKIINYTDVPLSSIYNNTLIPREFLQDVVDKIFAAITSATVNVSVDPLTGVGTGTITLSPITLPGNSGTGTGGTGGTSTVTGKTPAEIAALTNTQLSSLTAADLTSLTSEQLADLTIDQTLTLLDNPNLTDPSSLITKLVTAGKITPAIVNGLTPTQLIALSPSVIGELSKTLTSPTDIMAFIGKLTPTQIAGLPVSTLNKLTATELALLTPAQLAAMTIDQLTALFNLAKSFTPPYTWDPTKLTIPPLTQAQIDALNGIGVNYNTLSASELSALTSTQVAALTGTQLTFLLNNSNLVEPTLTNIIGMITSAQLSSLTATQLNSFSNAVLTLLGARATALSYTWSSAQLASPVTSAQSALLSSGSGTVVAPTSIAINKRSMKVSDTSSSYTVTGKVNFADATVADPTKLLLKIVGGYTSLGEIVTFVGNDFTWTLSDGSLAAGNYNVEPSYNNVVYDTDLVDIIVVADTDTLPIFDTYVRVAYEPASAYDYSYNVNNFVCTYDASKNLLHSRISSWLESTDWAADTGNGFLFVTGELDKAAQVISTPASIWLYPFNLAPTTQYIVFGMQVYSPHSLDYIKESKITIQTSEGALIDSVTIKDIKRWDGSDLVTNTSPLTGLHTIISAVYTKNTTTGALERVPHAPGTGNGLETYITKPTNRAEADTLVANIANIIKLVQFI